VNKYLQFLLSFTAISLVLYLLEGYVVFGYQAVLITVLSFFSSQALPYFYDSSFRVILLVALLLATPGVSIRRRLSFSFFGVLSLWAVDLISFAIWTMPPPLTPGTHVSKAHMVYSLIWRMLGHWVLPFVCWVIMTKESLAGRLAVKKRVV